MKADPEDLRKLADDLQRTMDKHPDACNHNPDITIDIRSARDKAVRRYHEVHTTGYDKDGNMVP